jgi:hypothetical protein
MATIPFAGVSQFRPYSSDIGSAVLQRTDALQKLKQQNLLNQMNQLKMADFPAQNQAKLDLMKAQAGQAYAKQQELAHPSISKNPLAIFEAGSKLFKQNPNDPKIPILAAMYNKAISSSSGIGVTTTPEGGTKVQIGGSQQSPGTNGLWGDPIVNPLTKGARGTKGMTYQDAKTGAIYSTPTVQETSKLQQSILSEKQIKNLVDDLVVQTKKSGYFDPHMHILSMISPLASLSSSVKNAFPEIPQAVSNLKNIDSSVTNAVERAITQGNLPRTEKTQDDLRVIFKPGWKETDATYKDRVTHQFGLYLKNAELQKAALNKGVRIGNSQYFRVRRRPSGFMGFVHPGYEYVKNPNYTTSPTTTASTDPNASIRTQPQTNEPTEADLEYTARKHNMSVAEVKKRLGIK